MYKVRWSSSKRLLVVIMTLTRMGFVIFPTPVSPEVDSSNAGK
jgi:hypothetical protein